MSNDLATRSVTQATRYDWDSDQIATIRRTVARDCSEAEFGVLLELASRYELDPFAGEIYAAKMGGNDGGRGAVSIVVGKNGMLKVASRDEHFAGNTGDVVRENDDFHVEHKPDGVEVRHAYSGKDRGDIIGAWASVYRSDRARPIYFFAPWATYNKGRATWKSHPEAMILKCALSNALRLAFSLSGLYDEAEMGVAPDADAADAEIDYGSDPQFADYLRRLFEEANRLRPGAYKPQKIRVLLAGKNEGELQGIAATLSKFIEEHGGVVPGIEPDIEAEAVEEPAE